MLELINQIDTQESTVKVDLLHLNPTDADTAVGGTSTGRWNPEPV